MVLPNNITAQRLIKLLKLSPHPEGGYYRRSYTSKETFGEGVCRPLGTGIYYLLEGDQYSTFHRLDCEETWHFYEGTCIILTLINQEGHIWEVKIGNPLRHENAHLQYTIPKNTWFAAELEDKSEFALVGCTCVPGYQDQEFGDITKLKRQFPQHASIIERLTKDKSLLFEVPD